ALLATAPVAAVAALRALTLEALGTARARGRAVLGLVVALVRVVLVGGLAARVGLVGLVDVAVVRPVAEDRDRHVDVGLFVGRAGLCVLRRRVVVFSRLALVHRAAGPRLAVGAVAAVAALPGRSRACGAVL